MFLNGNMWMSVTFLVLLNLGLTTAQFGDCFPCIENADKGPRGAKRQRVRSLAECQDYCENRDPTCLSFHYADSGRRGRCWTSSDPTKAYKYRNLNPAQGFTNYEFQCRIPDLGSPYVVTADMDLSSGSNTPVAGVTQLDKCHAACIADSTCGAWRWVKDNATPCSYYTGLPSFGSLSMTARVGTYIFDVRTVEDALCDGESERLSCPAGNGIMIAVAAYGLSTSSSVCSGPATQDCSVDVTTELGALCDGLAECTVDNPDSLSSVTDPCPTATGEFLAFTYVCKSISLPDHAVPSADYPSITAIASGERAYPDYQGTGGTRQDAIVDNPTMCGTACGDECMAYEYNRITGKCFHFPIGTVCNNLMYDQAYYHVKKPGEDCPDDPVGAAYVEP